MKLQSTSDLLQVINKIIPYAVSVSMKSTLVQPSHATFSEVGFDSLDQLIILMYVLELFGVDEKASSTIDPSSTIDELCEFIKGAATIHEFDLDSIDKQLKLATPL